MAPVPTTIEPRPAVSSAPSPGLSGRLDQLPAPELFSFLEVTAASGRLAVHGPLPVSLWWDDGALVAGEPADAPALEEAVAARGRRGGDWDEATTAVLSERRLEAVFELLVVPDAEFSFHLGDRPDGPVLDAVPSAELLAAATERVERWRAVAACIPDASVVARLAPRLPEGLRSVELDAADFELVVLMDGRRTLADITAETGASAFEVCERVHGLVQRGLAVIDR
jgi:hypothetical protein